MKQSKQQQIDTTRLHAGWLKPVGFVSRMLLCGLLLLTVLWVQPVIGQEQPAEDDGPQIPNLADYNLSLNVDPDMDSKLRKAISYAEEERYQDASLLFQELIDQASQRRLLSKVSEGNYRPFRVAVERALLDLPKEAREAYARLGEGEAKGLMDRAVGEDEERLLTRVVNRLFLTSLGDDAAYRLGCLFLDRGQYPAAYRYFTRALDHPDLNVPKEQIWLRLAFASSRMGYASNQRREAEKWLDRITRQGNANAVDAEVLTFVRQAIRESATAAQQAQARPEWRMRLGNESRKGQMQAIDDAYFNSGQAWTVLWDVTDDFQTPEVQTRNMRQNYNRNQMPLNRFQMLSRWRELDWAPVGEVLIQDGLAIYRVHNRKRDGVGMPHIVAVDTQTGRLVWEKPEMQPRELSGDYMQGGYYYPYNNNSNPNYPVNQDEIANFGDRLAKDTSIIDGYVHYVARQAWSTGIIARVRGIGGQSFIEFSNALVSVELATGKLAWSPIDRDTIGAAESEPVRFLCAPVRLDEHLIAVLLQQGDSIYLVAMDTNVSWPQRTPRVVWKTPLCSANDKAASDWTALGVAVEGSDVFVSTGRGVVFSIGLVDGDVRWAQEYDRSVNDNQNYYGYRPVPSYIQGWQDEVIFASGNDLVVTPSDTRTILVFDRITGKITDRRTETQAGYVIGAEEGGLYVGGKTVARKYTIDNGKVKLAWERSLKPMLGRGALTTSGVLLPVDDRIVRLNTDTGQVAGEIPVSTVDIMREGLRPPLGNLTVAEGQVFVQGLSRVYSLVNVDRRLELLASLIEKGDLAALEKRALLYRFDSKFALAAKDMREIVKQSKDQKQIKRVKGELFLVLLSLADKSPDEALALLDEAKGLTTNAKQETLIALSMARYHEQRQDMVKAFEQYLKVAADSGGATVELNEDGQERQVQASLMARRAISEILQSNPELKVTLAERAQTALNEAVAQNGYMRLIGVGRAFIGSEVSTKALLTAAERAEAEKRVDVAEGILKDMIRDKGAPKISMQGSLALAAIYERQGWKHDAIKVLKKLQRDHAQVTMDQDGTQVTVATLVQAEIDRLAKDLQPVSAMPEPEWEIAWRENNIDLRQNGINIEDDRQSEFMQQHMYMLQGNNEIVARQCFGKGERAWSIKLPSNNGPTTTTPTGLRIMGGNLFTTPNADLIRDGHIFVVAENNKLYAYSLMDGSKLWEEQMPNGAEIFSVQNTGRYYYSSQGMMRSPLNTVVAGEGVVAVEFDEPTTGLPIIQVHESYTGHLLWQLRLEKGGIEGIITVAGHVVVVRSDGKMTFHDTRSGEQTGQGELPRFNPNLPLYPLENGLAYYDAQRDRLMFISVPDARVWGAVTQASRGIRRIGVFDNGWVYAITNGRKLIVADFSEQTQGKLMADEDWKGVSNISSVAMANDNKLYLVGQNGNNRVLVIGDLKSGEQKSINLGSTQDVFDQFLSAETFSRSSKYLPMVTREILNQGNIRRSVFSFAFIDRETGKKLDKLELPGYQKSQSVTYVPPLIRGNMLIVNMANRELRAYRAK